MDTLNKQGVVVLFPRTNFTADEAMMFAAWLVTMAQIADDSVSPFDVYTTAVQET